MYDPGSSSHRPGEVSLVPDPAVYCRGEARRGKKGPFKRQLLHHTHEKVRKQVTVRHTDYKRLALMVLILRDKDIDAS